LRSFDLGGEHSFLTHIGVQEERLVREQSRDAVEPAESENRSLERSLQVALQTERRLWG